RIEPARDLERRALPDIALKTLAVIADVLDDAVGPIVGQPNRLAELALDAEEPPHLGIGRFELLVDIAFGDAELFGVEHSLMGPAHQVFPGVVALAHHRAERL